MRWNVSPFLCSDCIDSAKGLFISMVAAVHLHAAEHFSVIQICVFQSHQLQLPWLKIYSWQQNHIDQPKSLESRNTGSSVLDFLVKLLPENIDDLGTL